MEHKYPCLLNAQTFIPREAGCRSSSRDKCFIIRDLRVTTRGLVRQTTRRDPNMHTSKGFREKKDHWNRLVEIGWVMAAYRYTASAYPKGNVVEGTMCHNEEREAAGLWSGRWGGAERSGEWGSDVSKRTKVARWESKSLDDISTMRNSLAIRRRRTSD